MGHLNFDLPQSFSSRRTPLDPFFLWYPATGTSGQRDNFFYYGLRHDDLMKFGQQLSVTEHIEEDERTRVEDSRFFLQI
ncbi:hypothetical protein BH23ACT11_BH23ACT11_14590 [soil metagenome]